MNRSVAALPLVAAAGVAAQQPSAPPANPPGQAKAGKTAALEAGAPLLQSRAPGRGFDVYLVGFHPLKEARRRRADLMLLARSQFGVDDLRDRFARPGTAIPGVAPAR